MLVVVCKWFRDSGRSRMHLLICIAKNAAVAAVAGSNLHLSKCTCGPEWIDGWMVDRSL